MRYHSAKARSANLSESFYCCPLIIIKLYSVITFAACIICKFWFMKIAKLIFSALFVLISFSNCDKMDSPIPYVYVNFRVDLNDPSYNKLLITGGYANVTGGYKGILLYRRSMDEILAFDRACPHDPSIGRVSVEKTGLWAVCDSCKSEFTLMIDGAVKKGPSHYPLKIYNTSFNQSTNILTVYN
jgi:nitrite reductase/ring-hydroxylating ferredoxin subunit